MTVRNEYIENGYLRVGGGSQVLGDGPTAKLPRLLTFQSMPGDLGSSKAANYTPINILGRANPIQIYSNSGQRAWNLELKFFVTELPESTEARINAAFNAGDPNASIINTANDAVREQVLDKVNWCEALTYPIYVNNLSQGTAQVQFVFGDMINANCVCTDVQSSFPGPWYLKTNSMVGYPMYAIVNLTLVQIGGASFSYFDVIQNNHNSPNRR